MSFTTSPQQSRDSHSLSLLHVSIHSWPGYVAGEDVYEEVRQSLVDLAEERPEAMQLMRARTFARAVH